jgi:phosphatidylserine/phosphatidylglycerophosphate/cardiolipin synthase-like enzyme
MANKGVKGRIVNAQTGVGIKGLEIVVVDFDPLFSEDILGSKITDNGGYFDITYAASFAAWIPGRNPDIVVRVYGPGFRLLHETSEYSNVEEAILTIATIELHPANIEGWLVTNATLNPKNPALNPDGTPVTWTKGNWVEILKDGETVFPQLTDEIRQAQSSVNLMNMNFWLGKQLITKFDQTFIPDNPQLGVPVKGEKIHEVLKNRAKVLNSANVLVQDVPFIDQLPVISYLLRVIPFIGINPDSSDEVKECFRGSKVKVRTLPLFRVLSRLISFMHAKLVIIDGVTAFVMGTTIAQSYFGDNRHLIHDARHRGSLIHDMSIKVKGPAVEHIDRSFTTLWNLADSSGSSISPSTNHATQAADIGLQVVRTLPGGVIESAHTGGAGLPHGETGALESYQRAIAKAKNYIYLEDQYFTAPEIFTAMLRRMKQVTEAPNLEIIIVLNPKPDVPGYPEMQIQLIKQFQKELSSALGENQAKKRLGIYSLWSCDEQKPRYEIMPIYVHSKCAIIDDIWATVGSANLDGTSLNQFQLSTVVSGYIANLVEKGHWIKRVLGFMITVVLSPLIMAIVAGARIGSSRSTQHANPGQSRQPSRSVELNVTICEKDPNPSAPNQTVVAMREDLWREHLGYEISLPTPTNGWVEIWNDRAEKKKDNLQQDPAKAVRQRQKHPAKILPWEPKVVSEEYLKALKINTGHLKVREDGKADKFDFVTGKWE